MFHIAFVFVVVDAKIATIFEYPNKFLLLSKNLCSGSLKIAIRHPKISGLKISVHSLKISGLKIIARVCVYACVRVCAPHLANISKIAQDATRSEGTQAPGRPPQEEHKRPPQEQHQSRSNGAKRPERPPQAQEHQRTQRTRIAKEN